MTAPIRNVSDTAIWVAMYRARETERPNPVFRDPYARRLAGDHGEQIVAAMKHQDRNAWAYVIRTYLVDSFIRERVEAGADLVLNLAAGLDARPYRMDLPSSLQWIEVDLPEMIDYKNSVLASDKPKCRLERVAVDLSDAAQRRKLFVSVAARAKQALIVSEGLLIYLGAEGARGLAEDLAAQPSFRWWVFDIASPALLKMMTKQVGKSLDQANATLKFAPENGPYYFEQTGWRVAEVRGSLKSAAKILKLPWLLRFFSKFPENPRKPKGIWAGTSLLTRDEG